MLLSPSRRAQVLDVQLAQITSADLKPLDLAVNCRIDFPKKNPSHASLLVVCATLFDFE
jgi:hypothetical protein